MELRTIELKVGIFMLIGITILFIIVFSIGDIYLARPGYRIRVVFTFASGLTSSAPVRLAGVKVGQVEKIDLIYDKAEERTKAIVRAWIDGSANIEEDAQITINTLGLLGEKYLEIFPGTRGKAFVKEGATMVGHDPIPMERVTENLKTLSESVTVIVERLRKGEGTIGKLLVEDAVYQDLKSTMGNIKDFSGDLKREGGIGRLLFEEPMYSDMKAIAGNFKDFSEDIKRHPWKLLSKPRGE